MALRGIRGATCLTADDPVEMADAVAELVGQMLTRNDVADDDIVSFFLTCTPDLHSAFPAAAVRTLGFNDVPLMCAQEMQVTGALARVVRVLAHVESVHSRSDIVHVYLRGAEALRTDLVDPMLGDDAP